MMEKEVHEAIQRTLIVTLGESGQLTARRLEEVLAGWGRPPVVAVQHLDDVSSVEGVDESLREISRLSHRAVLSKMGYRGDRLGELVIWVVGPPDLPLADVARRLADRSAVLLGIEPLMVGLILQEAAGKAASPAPSFEDQGAEPGSLPPFNGPCYLISPVDETGLVLDDADALVEQAACFLALHTCTSLRDAPVWIEQAAGWSEGVRHASFGLRQLTWPGAVAQARAAHALGQAILEDVLGHDEDEDESEPDALLRSAALAPPLLAPRLIPPELVELLKGSADVPPTLQPWSLLRTSGEDQHPVLAQLEAAEAEVVAAVERQAGAWEPLTAAEVEKATELMRGWVAQALDAGGVRRARSLIKGVSWRLDQWVIGAEQRRVELEVDLEQIIRDTEAIRTALAGIVGQMPGRSLRSLLRLLRNPFRWVQFWGRWRKAGDLLARHYLVAAAALETRVTARQLAHAADVYLALGDALETISQEVEQLESDLRDLFSPGECPPWPDASTDLLGDAPDEVLARLAERLLPPVPVQVEAFLERWGPLSRWGEGTVVEEGTVSQWLSERTAPLATCSVWDVARCRFEQPDALRTWLEAWVDPVYPLWRWDPAALSEDERAGVGATKVFFSAPDGVRIWEDDGVGPRVLPLSRPDRMAVVALRWGIPDRSSEEV